MADRLPEGDAWHVHVEPFLHFTIYATAFRYPSPSGRVAAKPSATEVLADVKAVRTLLTTAKSS